MNTPWGKAQEKIPYAPGVTFYGTPSHGGFKVSKSAMALMPPHLRTADGWYEEDCEWSMVALAFPHLFKPEDVVSAQKTYDHWFVRYCNQTVNKDWYLKNVEKKEG